ncbi:haloacid dehalogenase [Alicyclobacillus contaminans]|uniref:Cof-type HAD-IIB family hydrolase n=1 Tax=Alicyclobacillus contaminans TaxID=392016 RepID=UPI00040ADE68|nr:Cof-type HAD-IIB family hydrolase [Alicyclobacillus contaminans]GMA50694.1 haloacid dehalogenase [Alicyclobacillus contaminans]
MQEGPLFIVIDIDGTLLNSRQSVDEDTWVAIQRAMEKGHFVTLATGRMAQSGMVWARYLQLNAPLIALNGAHVVHTPGGQHIQRSPIPEASLTRLAQFVEEHQLYCLAMGEHVVVCPANLPIPPKHWQLQRHHVVSPKHLQAYLEDEGNPVLKVTVGGFLPHRIDEVYAELASWGMFEMARTSEGEIEMTRSGVTKWTGIERVISALNIPVERVVAFGNAENDLDMLRHAGRGYAMAKAEAAVLREIPLWTASNDQCGVAKAIESILAERDPVLVRAR